MEVFEEERPSWTDLVKQSVTFEHRKHLIDNKGTHSVPESFPADLRLSCRYENLQLLLENIDTIKCHFLSIFLNPDENPKWEWFQEDAAIDFPHASSDFEWSFASQTQKQRSKMNITSIFFKKKKRVVSHEPIVNGSSGSCSDIRLRIWLFLIQLFSLSSLQRRFAKKKNCNKRGRGKEF